MEWIASVVFGVAAVAGAGLAYVLTANIERQPEGPSSLADGMRLVGLVITISGVVLGVTLGLTALRLYLGS